MSKQGVYLWAGGPHADRKAAIEDLRKALSSLGKEKPTVAYIGTASDDDLPFFRAIASYLVKAGAGEVKLVPIIRHYQEEEAKKMLTDADLIFITGGEVEDGIRGLEKHGLDAFLKDLYASGHRFMGVSAGAIMMGQHWVHWEKEGDDSTSSLFNCLGFLPYTFDAHGEDEDWAELKCAVALLGPGQKGYGLIGPGFFYIDPEGKWTCFHGEPAIYVNKNGKASRE